MTHWTAPDTPKTIQDGRPKQHLPASIGWTVGMLLAILITFLLVIWYTR